MTLSERIIGSKKLYDMVIPGATHALSADLNNADRFAIYFFASETDTVANMLAAGYRYFEVGIHPPGHSPPAATRFQPQALLATFQPRPRA